MPSIFDFSSTPGSNTSIDGVNVNTGMPVQNTDNAFRSLMAVIRQSFSSTLQNFLSGATPLPVASGGTGGVTADAARSGISAAKSGANSDITSLTGLTTALAVAMGGTGQATPIFQLTGDATAGSLAISIGGGVTFRLTWKDATFAANAATAVSYHGAFTSWSRAIVNAGQAVDDADANTYVSGTSASGCTVYNAINSSVSGTVIAWGV